MSLHNSSYNMVAPLSTCTVEELRIHWIHYVLWKLRCWNIHHTVRTWRHRTFTSPMKEHLRDQKFADDNEVMEVVRSFFLEGNCKLVDIWTKCVAKQVDYVEKWDTNSFYKYSSKTVIIKFLLFNDLPSYKPCKLFFFNNLFLSRDFHCLLAVWS